MAKIELNLKEEMQEHGMYNQIGTWYGGPYAPVQKLSPPISPKENLRRYYAGEDYEWIPDIFSDQVDITPHCNLDVDASDYIGGYDAFGVKWIPVNENAHLPAFVDPKCKLLDDIADWRNLEWPNPDSWSWEEYGKKYREALDDGRMLRGVILSGYFERLISIMGFEDAAVSMIQDPESVTEFFDKLTELNICIMDHYIRDFGVGSIMIHDDWSAQRSPFFSLNTAQTLISPQLKKLVDHAHEQGVIFILHSCGNGFDLIPAMKAAGIDGWQCQENAMDLEKVIEACGNDIIVETFLNVPNEIKGVELQTFLNEQLQKYCISHRYGVMLCDMNESGRGFETRKLIYEIGRKMAVEGASK